MKLNIHILTLIISAAYCCKSVRNIKETKPNILIEEKSLTLTRLNLLAEYINKTTDFDSIIRSATVLDIKNTSGIRFKVFNGKDQLYFNKLEIDTTYETWKRENPKILNSVTREKDLRNIYDNEIGPYSTTSYFKEISDGKLDPSFFFWDKKTNLINRSDSTLIQNEQFLLVTFDSSFAHVRVNFSNKSCSSYIMYDIKKDKVELLFGKNCYIVE